MSGEGFMRMEGASVVAHTSRVIRQCDNCPANRALCSMETFRIAIEALLDYVSFGMPIESPYDPRARKFMQLLNENSDRVNIEIIHLECTERFDVICLGPACDNH